MGILAQNLLLVMVFMISPPMSHLFSHYIYIYKVMQMMSATYEITTCCCAPPPNSNSGVHQQFVHRFDTYVQRFPTISYIMQFNGFIVMRKCCSCANVDVASAKLTIPEFSRSASGVPQLVLIQIPMLFSKFSQPVSQPASQPRILQFGPQTNLSQVLSYLFSKSAHR